MAPRPTQTGAVLPSSTALATDVLSSAVFHSAMSQAKKMPPMPATSNIRRVQWMCRACSRKGIAIINPAIPTRYMPATGPGTLASLMKMPDVEMQMMPKSSAA